MSAEAPAVLIETGDHRPPLTLMEDPAPYRAKVSERVQPLNDPDFIGAEAAFKRAAANAIARARAAGLEPVVAAPAEAAKPSPQDLE